jgi:orotate phosphoribosyltransferase-like protein
MSAGRRPGDTRFKTDYMDNAVFDLQQVVREAVDILGPVKSEFDTLVGTGFSGGLLIPTLALRLRRKFILIRKETDDSHHGSGKILGELGAKWIFVDDFTSSGATRRRVIDKITVAASQRSLTTAHVADYYYGRLIERRYRPIVPEPVVDDTIVADSNGNIFCGCGCGLPSRRRV